jgi:hypothetical protein
MQYLVDFLESNLKNNQYYVDIKCLHNIFYVNDFFIKFNKKVPDNYIECFNNSSLKCNFSELDEEYNKEFEVAKKLRINTFKSMINLNDTIFVNNDIINVNDKIKFKTKKLHHSEYLSKNTISDIIISLIKCDTNNCERIFMAKSEPIENKDYTIFFEMSLCN